MATLKQLFKTEYNALSNAKSRCYNPENRMYADYGGRGITVCDEWLGEHGFYIFLGHIGTKPDPNLSLDRIDNDKGYQPGNVRWATKSEQSRNRRPHWLKVQARNAPRNAEIKALADNGLTAPQIAQRMGLSLSQVYRIVRA